MADRSPRILIVDDSEQNRLLIELYLRGSEFIVTGASSGREALELVARDEEFDLVLLDVSMPEMGGIEVCERLKADPRTQHVPVIFVTARVQSESERLRAFAVGAVDFITKPVQRTELLARVRAMMRSHSEARRIDSENRRLSEQLEAVQRRERMALEHAEQLERLFGKRLAAPVHALEVAMDGAILQAWPGCESLFASDGAVVDLVGRPMSSLLPDAASVLDLDRTEQQAPRRMTTVSGCPVEVCTAANQPSSARWLLVRDLRDCAALEVQLEDRAIAELPAPQTEGRELGDPPGYRISNYVGESPAVRRVTSDVDMLRRRFVTTLIHGESGTGKEVIARALHFDGPFSGRPFIPIHCGAIAPELIESELFGHEKGAFTGALHAKTGLFQAADGGTVFLDEIAETPMSLQVKLLRVLQEGEVRPIGATKSSRIDVRIIAATNGDLKKLVEQGEFREDLFYRLDVVTIEAPPLRARVDDIPLLVQAFIRELNARHGLREPVSGISRGALEALRRYSWPGNVRELENVIERAFALGCSGVIERADLPQHIVENSPRTNVGSRSNDRSASAEEDAVDPDVSVRRRERKEITREAIVEAIRAHRGKSRKDAWTSLGIGRSTFYRHVKRYRLDIDELMGADGDGGVDGDVDGDGWSAA